MRMQFAAALLCGAVAMACSAPQDSSAMTDDEPVAVAENHSEISVDETVSETAAETVTTEAAVETETETLETVDPSATQIEETVCTQDYAPVCGVDGETYGNACEAASASVEVASDGECPQHDESTEH